jgi:hypothetical protein
MIFQPQGQTTQAGEVTALRRKKNGGEFAPVPRWVSLGASRARPLRDQEMDRAVVVGFPHFFNQSLLGYKDYTAIQDAHVAH